MDLASMLKKFIYTAISFTTLCSGVATSLLYSEEVFNSTEQAPFFLPEALVIVSRPNGNALVQSYNKEAQLTEFFDTAETFHYLYHYNDQSLPLIIQDLINNTLLFREYDNRGRLTQEECDGLISRNLYDANGNRIQHFFPDGSSARYVYDDCHLRAVERLDFSGNLLYSHNYTEYTTENVPASVQLIGDAGSLHFNYQDGTLISSIESAAWKQKIDRNLTKPSKLLYKIQWEDCLGENNSFYTYDSRERLIKEEGAFEMALEYDDLGNRLIKNEVVYSIENSNQYSSTVLGDDYTLYYYDLNGNLTAKLEGGQWTRFEYDGLDRMTSAEREKEILVQYTYDALFRRRSKATFVWDETFEQWQLMSQQKYLYDDAKEIGATNCLTGETELRILGMGFGAEIGASIAIEIDGYTFAPIHNHRGDICCLVDMSTGAPVEFYQYSAFGEAAIYSAEGVHLPHSAFNNPWMFSSKRYDPETGLVYFGKRYLDTTTGRWLSKDPLGSFDGKNPYTYVHNNPLTQIDAYGLFTWPTLWECACMITDTVKSFVVNAQEALTSIKSELGFAQYVEKEYDSFAKALLGEGFLQFSGFYKDTLCYGSSHHEEETHDKVRITMINGILNMRNHLEDAVEMISEAHGGAKIHYVFNPTQGWSKDLLYSTLSKLGFVSPQAVLLANSWKNLIEEMGGVDGGGEIIHYAHSIGATDSFLAKGLLTPEEAKMIHMITLGSPSLNPLDEDFASVTHYVSKRDGVSMLDPYWYFSALLTDEYPNIHFLGSFDGIPFVDHTLYTDSYNALINQLGSEFLQSYPPDAVQLE